MPSLSVAYLPLPRLIPPPAIKEHKIESMEYYEAMKPVDFIQLPLEVRQRVSNERNKLGKPTFMYGWGNYDEQRPLLVRPAPSHPPADPAAPGPPPDRTAPDRTAPDRTIRPIAPHARSHAASYYESWGGFRSSRAGRHHRAITR